MKSVRVNLGNRSYDILIGSKLLPEMGDILKQRGLEDGVCIVTDDNVGELYIEKVAASLEKSRIKFVAQTLPAGEGAKSLVTATGLYDFLTRNHVERGWSVLALGGGVVGDVAGFVASTYMRGIGFVQVPTTLLAQVDSSVGGKVAVNFAGYKNIIGSFYQPLVVVSDIDTLLTLPVREYRSALAEAVKYGVIRDEAFFSYLENNVSEIMGKRREVLEEVVEKCCRIKAEIVEEDEKDRGIRALLNFGHTVGHAVESVLELGTLTHGEAVSLGMVVAGRISLRLGFLKESEFLRLETLLHNLDFALKADSLKSDDVLKAVERDKKVRAREVRFALTKGVGSAIFPCLVPTEVLKECLTYIVR